MQQLLLIIAVVLRIVANPLANVYQKQLSRGNHPLLINFLTYAGLSVLCLAFFRLLPAFHPSPTFWTYAILGGIVGATGNGLLVKALEKGELSVLGPINAYKSVVGIIVGIFLLRELPNIWGLAGVGLIIYGSYFVLDTTGERFSWALLRRPEIKLRLGALVLTAIEAVFTKKVIEVSSPVVAFVAWCWLGALFSLIFLKLSRLQVRLPAASLLRGQSPRYLLLIGCTGIMQLTTTYTFDNMNVGYALSLFQLSVIVSVLLGHRLFGEQNLYKKLLGSAIMIAGSVVIILFK